MVWKLIRVTITRYLYVSHKYGPSSSGVGNIEKHMAGFPKMLLLVSWAGIQ